jgi:beta-lactam-binding protein with PASTA domain
MSDKTKRILSDRYEIESVVGQGGMAKVFRGTDRVLGRTVAVKVLSPQFAEDHGFVERFRREAQAAAGLNHQNIVSVFDTGSHRDVHYIVMELVQGKSLRDVIRSDGPLLPDRAAEIGRSVARALGAAHQAGLVHRDVKPGNIMITSEGEVKVMDFGIARTTSGDTLTQTAAVLGTASYLSPEQAQGEPVDGRSDLYSLGCVLYEMVTSRPPFTGDSAVSIAYKHVKDDPTPPSHLNADVPHELEAVILKCMAKNPANRYQTAAELIQDLDRLAAGLPTLATPVLGEGTQVLTRAGEGTQVMDEAPPEEEEGKRKTWLIVLITLLVLALLGLAAFFLVRALLGGPETVALPNVVGKRERAAVSDLEAVGMTVEVERRARADTPRGEVFRQDPEANEQVEVGSTVRIFVSRGPPQVEVPGVIGLSQEDARAALEEAGLGVGETNFVDNEEPEGTVVDQTPAEGTEVEEGSAVNLVISGGPGTVAVPDVQCNSEDQARQKIEDADLVYEEVGEGVTTDCPPDTTFDQNPSAGTQVQRGQVVRVRIAAEPEVTPTETES